MLLDAALGFTRIFKAAFHRELLEQKCLEVFKGAYNELADIWTACRARGK